MTPDINATHLDAHAGEIAPAQGSRSPIANVFMGPHGIRAGWRLLIFIAIFVAIASSVNFGVRLIPSVRAWQKAQNPQVMVPSSMIMGEGIAVLAMFAAAWLMTLIEKRSFADYYLPPNQAFGKRFWQGIPYGFAMLSLLLVLIAAFRGFSLGNMALSGADALKFGAAYGVGFILVGIFEEFSFRGYMQSTLGFGNRFLACGDRSFDFVWRDPSAEPRRGMDRRGDGRFVRHTRSVQFAADREYLVPDRDARGMGLG